MFLGRSRCGIKELAREFLKSLTVGRYKLYVENTSVTYKMKHQIPIQLIFYGLSGGAAFLLNLIITFFLTEYLNFWYLISVVIGTVASWTAMFIFNFFYTFRGHRSEPPAKQYFKHILMYLVSAPVGLGLIYLLTSIFGIYYLLSQTLVVGTMAAVSFILSRRFIFRFD